MMMYKCKDCGSKNVYPAGTEFQVVATGIVFNSNAGRCYDCGGNNIVKEPETKLVKMCDIKPGRSTCSPISIADLYRNINVNLMNQPIIIDKDNNILDGNARYIVALMLGNKEILTTEQKDEDL